MSRSFKYPIRRNERRSRSKAEINVFGFARFDSSLFALRLRFLLVLSGATFDLDLHLQEQVRLDLVRTPTIIINKTTAIRRINTNGKEMEEQGRQVPSGPRA